MLPCNYEEDKNKVPMNKPYNIQNTNICNCIFHISFFKALLINEGEATQGETTRNRLKGILRVIGLKRDQDEDTDRKFLRNPNLKENMKNEAQNAIGDAIKVLHFMVQNNLPLDLFSSLVDLIVELGGDNLKKTHFLIKLSVLVHTYCPFIHRSHA